MEIGRKVKKLTFFEMKKVSVVLFSIVAFAVFISFFGAFTPEDYTAIIGIIEIIR